MPPLVRSTLFALAVASAIVAVFVASYSGASTSSDAAIDQFVCEVAREWRTSHARDPDLQIVISEATFEDAPGNFVRGEAMVVAPIAVSLPGAQEVLDVRASPPPSRMLEVEGTKFLTWEYAGRVHRSMRFTGVALVKRARSSSVASPRTPTFDALPSQLRTDAVLTARDLEEHKLDACKAFEPWVRATAGDPPYTEQLARLVRHVSNHLDETEQDRKIADDICNALRTSHFSKHQGEVAVVMALRQLGAPALGFATADGLAIATYVDTLGWIAMELGKHPFYRAGGAPIIVAAPSVGRFEATVDGLWSPAAAAYVQSSWGLDPISYTQWRPPPSENKTDETRTRSMRLEEACP